MGHSGEVAAMSRLGAPGGNLARESADKSAAAAAKANALKAPENAVRTAAAEAGYKTPAAQAEATLMNRLSERLTGKVRSEQKASVHNQEVTNNLTRKTLGLGEDEPLTPETLNRVRADHGKVYDEVRQALPQVAPNPAYRTAIQRLEQEAGEFKKYRTTADQADAMLDVVHDLSQANYSSADAVMLMKKLRSDAKANADSASAKGGDVVLAAKARAQKAGAQALEQLVDDNLVAAGRPDLMQKFVDARKRIAQTYTVEKALNPSTGNVSAGKLAQVVKSGKPLSGDMRLAGEFAGAFPRASRTPESIGSVAEQTMPDGYGVKRMATAAVKPLLKLGSIKPPRPVVVTPSTRAANAAAIQQALDRMGQGTVGMPQMFSAPALQNRNDQ
jgi:hypothetical protein